MIFGGSWESQLARFVFVQIRTATKRASGGKAANNSTAGRRLGLKMGEGQFVEPGQIIWRQRGTKWFPGENAGIGRDHTIFAKEPGYVRYYRDPFHAKRRFIGIALGHDDRLPTPHFEPRKRRFGYTPIENAEVAQFEEEFLTRKETHRLKTRETILQARSDARTKRLASYSATLKESGAGDVSDAQLQRLDRVYQFISGGASVKQAYEIVDRIIEEDLDIEQRSGRLSPEMFTTQLAAVKNEQARIDALVGFGESHRLAPVSQISEAARTDAVSRILKLAEPYLESAEGTPENVAVEIKSILRATPTFSEAEVSQLKSKYLRRPTPVLVTPETKASLESRAQKGAGELRDVWDSKVRAMKQYFVPSGAKLIFH